ncbi:hypothetical protein SNA_23760 [Streptomyces natalensis ATCC 27448]|uniref:Uncharacterized protein n=1 Tax=Streptomyces natalensis ATCC 27448 TaxID=1240678 RepID=A0A0D7CJJ6_9ACTN|nr:hypothetical protein SNA_23760 [Streptomyces natalensis ATCC 27448]
MPFIRVLLLLFLLVLLALLVLLLLVLLLLKRCRRCLLPVTSGVQGGVDRPLSAGLTALCSPADVM